MPLTLQPATKENAMQRADIMMRSISDDPLQESIMSGVSHEDKVKFFGERMIKALDNPGLKKLEIVDTESGKVVAFADWQYPSPKEKQKCGVEVLRAFPEGTNLAIMQGVFKIFGELSEKYYDAEKIYYLGNMRVLLEYQRRGLGQQLMEEALRDADENCTKCFLTASDAGKRLYSNNGIVELEVVSLDFMHLGETGKRNLKAMIRAPKA